MRLKIANSNIERYNFGVYKRTGDTKICRFKDILVKTGCLFI